MSDTDHLYIKPTADVVWGAPKTIRELIAQLETMDPDIKVHGALHTEFDGKPVARCRYLGMSFERVDAPWIRASDHDVPYSLVFWTQEDKGLRTPPDIPPPQPSEVVDASLLRERISRAIFDPGQTEGVRGPKQTLTDWQTDAVMRVLGFVAKPVDSSPVDNIGESGD